MEFIQNFAVLGGLISVLCALLSFRYTGKRLDVEVELNERFRDYLEEHRKLLEELESAKSKNEIRLEVNKHLVEYEKLLNEIAISMPDEKRAKVYPAINQKSERGKVAYISKLISKSLAKA